MAQLDANQHFLRNALALAYGASAAYKQAPLNLRSSRMWPIGKSWSRFAIPFQIPRALWPRPMITLSWGFEGRSPGNCVIG